MHLTKLHCTALHCTSLHFTTLHYTKLCCSPRQATQPNYPAAEEAKPCRHLCTAVHCICIFWSVLNLYCTVMYWNVSVLYYTLLYFRSVFNSAQPQFHGVIFCGTGDGARHSLVLIPTDTLLYLVQTISYIVVRGFYPQTVFISSVLVTAFT